MRFYRFSIHICVVLLTCVPSFAGELESALQSELNQARESAASFFYRVPIFSGLQTHYYVPATLGSIFKSHQEEDLVIALETIQLSADTNDKAFIQNWLTIVKSRVHGISSTVTSAAKSIPVVIYSIKPNNQNEPNKAPEPTPTSVTDRASARSAPAAGAAHL